MALRAAEEKLLMNEGFAMLENAPTCPTCVVFLDCRDQANVHKKLFERKCAKLGEATPPFCIDESMPCLDVKFMHIGSSQQQSYENTKTFHTHLKKHNT